MAHRKSTRLALEQNFAGFAPSITALRSEGFEDFEIQEFIAQEISAMREAGESQQEIEDFLNLAEFQPEPTGLGERFLKGGISGLTLGAVQPETTPASGEIIGRGGLEVLAETGGQVVGALPWILLSELLGGAALARLGGAGIRAPAALGLTAPEATAAVTGLARGAIAGPTFTGLSLAGQAIGPGGLPSGEDAIKELITNTALFGLAGAGLRIRGARRMPLTQAEAELRALPAQEQRALPPGPTEGQRALPLPREQLALAERAGPGQPALGESRILEGFPTDLPEPRIGPGRAAVQRPFEVPGEIATGRPRLTRPSAFEIQLTGGKALLRPRGTLDAPLPELKFPKPKTIELEAKGPITTTQEFRSKTERQRKGKPSKAIRPVPDSPEAIIKEFQNLEIPNEVVSESIVSIESQLPSRGLPEVAKNLRKSKGRVNKTRAATKRKPATKKAKTAAKKGSKALLKDIALEEAKVTDPATIVENPAAMEQLRSVAQASGLKVRFQKGQGFIEGKVGPRKVKVPFNDPDIALKEIFKGFDEFAETGPLTQRELSNSILDYERSIQKPSNKPTPDPGGFKPMKCLSPCKPIKGAKEMLKQDERAKSRELLNDLEDAGRAAAEQVDETGIIRNRGKKPKKPFGAKFWSPSFYMETFKEGLDIIRRVDEQTRRGQIFRNESLNRTFGKANKLTGKRSGGISELNLTKLDSQRVGVVLENPSIASSVEPKIRKAASILRTEFTRLLKEARQLAPNETIGRIKDYLPRLFDREFLRAELQAEIAEFGKLGTPEGVRKAAQSSETLAQLDRIGGLTYEQMPTKLRNRFFERRTGRGGYEFDALKAYDTYLGSTTRKLFMEPILRDAPGLIGKLPDNMKGLAVEYIRDATGLNRGVADSMGRFLAGVREFQFFRTIGLNPATALKNATQQLFTATELGRNAVVSSRAGWELSFTNAGKNLFELSGHHLDVPNIFLPGESLNAFQPVWKQAVHVSGYLFNKVETANRRFAYLAGLDSWFRINKGKTQGVTLESVLRNPELLPEGARVFADDLVRKTQFRYGKVDLPLLLRNEAVGTALQFSSFAVKASELMWKWAAREGTAGKMKLVAFLGAAGTIQVAAGLVGFPTLGDGTASPLSVPEMIEFLGSVTEGDWDRAKAAAFNTLDFDPLSIGFGPAVSGALEAGEVIRKAKEGLPVGEAIKRFGFNELAPVALNRIFLASEQLEAGGPPGAFVSVLLGVPSANAILRKQAKRLVEQGKTQELRDFISAIREAHGGVPKDFLSGSFKRKARRELRTEQRRKKRERRGESDVQKQIRKRFTRTERLIRNRFIRPIGGF